MKTWHITYGLIWAAALDILLGVYLPFDYPYIVPVHAVVGLLIVALAFSVHRRVDASHCPDRIRRISTTTWYLAILQLILGALLVTSIFMSLSGTLVMVVVLIHLLNALAIITQASSSATAFDMWEENEFAAPIRAPTG